MLCLRLPNTLPVTVPVSCALILWMGSEEMFSNAPYEVKEFNLSGLSRISDKTLEMHFKLYAGYVNETNLVNEKITEYIRDGHVDQDVERRLLTAKRKVAAVC